MATKNKKADARVRRKRSIRKKIHGTAARPRLSVFRSSQHIYAQLVDDTSGVTLVSASTLSPEVKAQGEGKRKLELAELVGQLVGQKALAGNVEEVVFDRNGFIYHGRVKAVAEGARAAGLKF